MNSLLISILPWIVLWLVSPLYFSRSSPRTENFNLVWLSSALVSFLIVSAVLAFNLARLLERFGYSKGDVVRIHEILSRENVNLLKAVRGSIHYHFAFWGVYVTASLVYGPVKSALCLISIVAGVILLSSVMLLVFVFVVEIPAFLYFTLKGELDKVRGLFEWVIEVSVASLILLVLLRVLALHVSVPDEWFDVGEFYNLLHLVWILRSSGAYLSFQFSAFCPGLRAI